MAGHLLSLGRQQRPNHVVRRTRPLAEAISVRRGQRFYSTRYLCVKSTRITIVVNRKMKPAQVISLIRRLARRHDLTVMELPGRGKGSHRIFKLVDASGAELARFGVTGHGSRDMSWTVLSAIEDGLAPLLGEKWTEKR